MLRYDCLLACLILLVPTVGCDSGPRTTGLQGDVSFEGRAVERGTIDFVPVDGTGGGSASASIANGHFEVAANGGVRTDGTYRVRIVGLKKTGRIFRNRETEQNFLPAIYNSESTLKVHVPDLPDKNKVDFQLPETSSRNATSAGRPR